MRLASVSRTFVFVSGPSRLRLRYSVRMEAAGPAPAEQALAPPPAPAAVATTRPPPKKYSAVSVPSPEQLAQEEVINHPVTRTLVAGVLGGAMGGVFGAFMGAFELQTETAEGVKLGAREIARQTARGAAAKSWSYAKGFSAMGALYSGSEVVVEKARRLRQWRGWAAAAGLAALAGAAPSPDARSRPGAQLRARHDSYNSAAAGCFTGGVLARSGATPVLSPLP